MLNQYFDKIYCINLDERPDRLQNITNQFSKINSTFQRFPAIKAPSGKDGCRWSHMAILNDAKANGYKRILICEDDLILRKKLVEDLPRIVEEAADCDMLFFHHHPHKKIRRTSKFAIPHESVWLTHMYAVFNIDKVLEYVESNNNPNVEIDGIYANSGKNLNTYLTTEEYAFQSTHFSDIANEYLIIHPDIGKYDDLLIKYRVEEHDDAFNRFLKPKNKVFQLVQPHNGMGDVIVFLSKAIEVASHYGKKHIKLSKLCPKHKLFNEIIGMISSEFTFEWTDEAPTIKYEWYHICNVKKYAPLKPQFQWSKKNTNVIAYMLDGSDYRSGEKNCSKDEIEYFLSENTDKFCVNIHEVRELYAKVATLLYADEAYGIDTGNTHLACLLGVPLTLVKNNYSHAIDDIRCFDKLPRIATVYHKLLQPKVEGKLCIRGECHYDINHDNVIFVTDDLHDNPPLQEKQHTDCVVVKCLDKKGDKILLKCHEHKLFHDINEKCPKCHPKRKLFKKKIVL